MPLRRSRSTRFIALLVTGLIAAVLSLIVFAPGVALASDGSCGWQASYWNNRDLQGQPVLVRCDQAIDFDWEGLSPDVSINVDNFSARWVRTYHFDAGTYRFQATMDDGMRVLIDGKVIISDWDEGKGRTLEIDVPLNQGPHKIVVEYFEKGGVAIAGVTWFRLDTVPMPPNYPPDQPEYPTQPQPPGAKPMPMPPHEAGVTYPVAEVKAYHLNVRTGPGSDNRVIAVIDRGTKVYMIARSAGGKWVQIKTDGVNGWVNRYYLHTDFPYTSLSVAGADAPGTGGPGQPKPIPPAKVPTTMVNASSLNVRSGPGVQYHAIAVVHGGTEVVVLGKEANGWVKIQIPGGAIGWVNGSYLTIK